MLNLIGSICLLVEVDISKAEEIFSDSLEPTVEKKVLNLSGERLEGN